MRQIGKNLIVAISGEWFTAHAKGISLGYFCKPENINIADKLKKAFAEWIDNGHNNFDSGRQKIDYSKLRNFYFFNKECLQKWTKQSVQFG